MSNEELAERIKNGEKDLILPLWGQVRKLVIKITRRYLSLNGSSVIEPDDLLQAGFIGMLRAVEDFDSTSGFSFTTFLDKHVRNACRALVGISGKKRDPLLSSISLDEPLSSDSDIDLTLIDTVSDSSQTYVFDDLLEELDRKEEIRIILAQVERLDSLEREIFTERYVDGLSLKRIAKVYNMDTQEVNSLINKSISKIRNTGAVRLLWERRLDNATRFYAHKGVTAFKSSFSSIVEDVAIERERFAGSHC